MADSRRLVELGMVPPLAKELAAQITAGVGDKRRLAELGMATRLASEVATQIATPSSASARRLAELSMVPLLARETASQIQSEGPALAASFWQSVLVGDADKTFLVAGDSTGNGYNEWVYRLVTHMEARETSHRIDYYLYDDATKAYLLTNLLGRTSTFGVITDTFERADGPVGTVSSGGQSWAANSWTIVSGRAVPNATGSNLVAVSALNGTSFKFSGRFVFPSAGTMRVYFLRNGVAGSSYLLLAIDSGKTISLSAHDGTTLTAIINLANSAYTPGVEYDIDIVKDGDRISVLVRGAGLAGAVAAGATLSSGQETALTGRNIYLVSVTAITGHAWQSFSAGNLVVPARLLKIRNGSISGTGFTYHTTNIATIIPERPDLAIVSIGHNEGTDTPATFLSNYSTYVTALRAQAGGAPVPIVATIQNPETSPAVNAAAHNARMVALNPAALTNGWDKFNVYDAFNSAPGGLSTLVDPADGVHPLDPGSILWEAIASARMGIAP